MTFNFALASCPEENPPNNGTGDDIDNNDNDNDEPGDDNKPDSIIDEIIAALSGQEGTEKNNPAVLKLELELAGMNSPDGNWQKILTAIDTVGKYVALDLSACANPASYFYPAYKISIGKNKIVSLILPDAVNSITGLENDNDNAFKHFINLEYISGKNITHIGSYAFYNCQNLKEIDFPAVTVIESSAFQECKNLTEAVFPQAKLIGSNAFDGCINLETVNIPKITIIDQRTFNRCASLTEVNFPSVTIIGDYAFNGCVNLEKAEFPANPERTTAPAHPLDPWRYKIPGIPCTSDSVLVHAMAFNGCASLKTLDFRNAWNVYFAGHSLANIGTHLDIYLFDDDGTKSYGHPQVDLILGNDDTKKTLETIKLILPDTANSRVIYHHTNPTEGGYHGIAVYIFGIFGVPVEMERY